MSSGFRQVLRFRGFLALWLGEMVSRLGDSIETIALIWFALEATGSPLVMGTVMIFDVLPNILFSVPAGVYVDRWNRKRVMIISEVARGLIIIAVPFLYWASLLRIWHLFVISFVVSSFETFFEPARNASVPNLLPKEMLMTANSMMQISSSLAEIIGLALGGIIVALIGVAMAFMIDSVSFLFSALAIASIAIPFRTAHKKRRISEVWQDLKEGFGFIKGNSTILTLMVFIALLNFVFGPLEVALPLFSEKVLKVGAEGFGYMISTFMLGGIFGAIFMGEWIVKQNKRLLMTTGFVGMALCIVVVPLCKTLLQCLMPLCLAGLFMSVARIPIDTMIQTETPDEIRGRVFSLQGMIALSAMPISLAFGGAFIEFVGLRNTVFLIAGIIIATTLALERKVRIRE